MTHESAVLGCPGVVLGVLDRSGVLPGGFGRLLGRLRWDRWRMSQRSWAVLRSSWRVLGRPGALPGGFGELLGRLWGGKGVVLSRLGGPRGGLRRSWAALG